MAEKHRPEAEEVIDVAVAVDIDQMGTLAMVDEERMRLPSRPGGAGGRVHATGDELQGFGEELAAAGVAMGVCVGERQA